MEIITAQVVVDTINQLHKEQITGRCISDSKRKQYVDNINTLFYLIKNNQIYDNGKYKVQLTSSILRKYLTKIHSKFFIESLIQMNVLTPTTNTVIKNGVVSNVKYQVGKFGLTYEIIHKDFISYQNIKREIITNKSIMDVYSSPSLNQSIGIIQNTNFKFIEKLIFKFGEQQEKKIVNTCDAYNSRRYYHTLTHLKKIKRSNLYYGEVNENNKIISVDITAAMWTTITNVNLLKNQIDEDTYHKLLNVNTDKLKELGRNGNLYCFLLEKYNTKYNTNNSKIWIKKAIPELLNNIKPNRHCKMYKLMEEYVPELLELSSLFFNSKLNNKKMIIKDNNITYEEVADKQKFSYIYNIIEERIICSLITLLNKRNIPCCTLHDSILIKNEDKYKIKDIIQMLEKKLNIKFK